MGETKKLKLTKSKDNTKDVIEIEVNLNNLDTIINILENGFEKGEESFFINYDNDDNLDVLCEIIFDFGYEKLGIIDNSLEIKEHDFKKIADYFSKLVDDIKLYGSNYNNIKELIKKFNNKLVEKANEKYGYLKKYGFEDKNFQTNLERYVSEDENFQIKLEEEFFPAEFTKFLYNFLIKSNNFILKNELNTQNKNYNKIIVEDFKQLIREIKSKEDVNNFIEKFKKSNLNGNKEILKFAFEKRGTGFLKPLLNDKDINWELDENDIEDLFICAYKNTCSNPGQVIKYFFDKFSDKIDINELYKKENFQSGKTPFDYIINNSENPENDDLIKILIKNLDLENLKLIDNKNKYRLLYLSIIYNNDVNLFKDYYNGNIQILKNYYNGNIQILKDHYNDNIQKLKEKYKDDNNELEKQIKDCNDELEKRIKDCNDELEKRIKDCNFKCIKQFYTKEYINIVDILNFIKMDEKNFSDFLNNDLIKTNFVNIELLNNILTSRKNNFQYPKTISSDLKVEGQGAGQIMINERTIEYDEDKNPKTIKTIQDIIYTNLKNEKENRKLYEVIYKDDGTQEITYYKKNGNILDKILIDENGEIRFAISETELNKEEINEILNDDYKSIDGFDYKLSFLSYTLLKNEENVVLKTNYKSIENIVDIIKDSNSEENKNKIFICDFAYEEHRVQVVINNCNVTILNTGYDFEHVRKEIEEKCKGTEVKQIETINQSCNNCDIASKLYTVVLAEKYKENFENLENLSKRLNNFQEFMENTLNKKEEEQKNNFNNFDTRADNYEMLKTILETNIKLLDEYKKHFIRMDNRLEKFYKIAKNIDKDKNIELRERHKVISIINLRNKMKDINELKNNNDKYSKIMDYIVKNSRNILENEETNKIATLKKNKILLKIIKHNIDGKEIKVFKNNQENIIKNINNILEKEQKTEKDIENVFKDCIKEISNSTPKELEL